VDIDVLDNTHLLRVICHETCAKNAQVIILGG